MQRNIIRIVDMPEKVEGLNVGKFVERWIKTIFPDAEFSMALGVERAHRVPAISPQPGEPARPLLARLLNCKA